MTNLFIFVKKHSIIISLLCLGIGIRLIYSLLFNQMFDFMNILALVRSVAETGNLVEGLNALKRVGYEVQLYGKIYYQIIALWLSLLDKIKLLHISYLFDTKPFTDSLSYMIGLWQWSPPLYQLVAIKLIQFVWDALFVTLIYITARKINKQLAYLSILFWALNPYLMMMSYSFLMPEVFMLAMFVGGTYFWLKALDIRHTVGINKFTIIALLFFVLGAIIKQVPILIIPFVLISTNKNIKTLFVYVGITFLAYILFKQSWSADSVLINKLFLFSKESTALFRNSFNSIPYFFIFYSLFIISSFIKKESIYSKPSNVFLTIIAVITLIYVNDSIFFIQFVTWIIPFAFLYSLYSTKNWWMFALAMLGMTIKAWNNEAYLSTILTPAIGSMYNEHINNKYFINQYFNFDLYDMILRFATIFTFILISIESILLLFTNKTFITDLLDKLKITITIKQVIFLSFVLYIFFNVIDYGVKSTYVLLPQNAYQISTNEILLTGKPISATISNQSKRTITALQLYATRKTSNFNEYTTVDIITDNKKVLSQKINDLDFPVTSDDPMIITLKKPMNYGKFKINIYKNKGTNKIAVFEASVLNQMNKPQNSLFNGYEKPRNDSIISAAFESTIIPLSFKGRYEIRDIMNAISFHANSKIKIAFFSAYLIMSLFFILLSILIFRIKVDENSR